MFTLGLLQIGQQLHRIYHRSNHFVLKSHDFLVHFDKDQVFAFFPLLPLHHSKSCHSYLDLHNVLLAMQIMSLNIHNQIHYMGKRNEGTKFIVYASEATPAHDPLLRISAA